MAYAFVDAVETSSDGTTTTSLAAASRSITAGDLLIHVTGYNAASATTTSISDTAGNSWTRIGTELDQLGSQDWYSVFYAIAASTTSTTITATFGASVAFRAVMSARYSGISAFDIPSARSQQSPGTGTDAVTSNATSNTANPALVFGFSIASTGTGAPTQGTGFTSRGTAWSYDNGGAGTKFARFFDKRVVANASQLVTATALGADGAADFSTLMAIFTETAGGATGLDIPRNIRLIAAVNRAANF